LAGTKPCDWAVDLSGVSVFWLNEQVVSLHDRKDQKEARQTCHGQRQGRAMVTSAALGKHAGGNHKGASVRRQDRLKVRTS
jgi:hypothetical protein